MKTFTLVIVIGSFLLSPVFAQWEHLGSGLVNPPGFNLAVSSLTVIDSNHIWAIPFTGTNALPTYLVYGKTEDGGITWQTDTISQNVGYQIRDAFALNPDTVWIHIVTPVATGNAKLYRTNDGGTSWTEQTGPFNNPGHGIVQVHFFNADTGIAFGNTFSGPTDTLRIYRTTNGGSTWSRISPTQLPAPVGTEISQTWSNTNNYDASGDTLWLGTNSGRIWRTTDQGLSWTATLHGASLGTTSSIQFKNHLEGMVSTTSASAVAVTTDGGNSWTSRTTPFPVRFIEYVPQTSGTYIISSSYFDQSNHAITQDTGLTWQALSYAYPPYLASIHMLSPTKGFAGGWVVNADTGGVFQWLGDATSYQASACNSCVQTVSSFPQIEDFEGNGGGWCQSAFDDFDWMLSDKATGTFGTGPNAPFAGNYYLLLEASNPHISQTATLVSPCYSLDAACVDSAWFSFRYHMSGTGMGSLDIAVSTDSGQSWSLPLLGLSGDQGNAWQSGHIDLSSYIGQTIRLRIRGNTSTSELGDIGLDNLFINTSSVINITAIENAPLCNGDSSGQISISATGGTMPYSYTWSNGDTTGTNSNLTAGGYLLTIVDDNGCEEQVGYILADPPALSLSLTAQATSCFGDSDGSITTTHGGGTGNITYLWSNNAISQNLSSIPAGTYTLSITDENGCKLADSVTVAQPDSLDPNFLITNVSCPGDLDGAAALQAIGGTPPYTLFWSLSSDTFATNLAPGMYGYSLADGNLCITTGSFTVGEPDSIDAQLMISNVSCNGASDGSIVSMTSGGNGGFIYSWSTGATGDSIGGLGPGTYTLAITDSKNCTGGGSANINEPDSLALNLTGTNESSAGSGDGSIDLSVAGGTAPYTFAWSNGETTEDLSGLSTGSSPDSTFQVTVTDANGCTKIDSVTLSTVLGIDFSGAYQMPLIVPNPASDIINLSFYAHLTGVLKLEVYNMQGQLMIRTQDTFSSGTQTISLRVDTLPSGQYMLHISDGIRHSALNWIKL